jgi:hypothetical protein
MILGLCPTSWAYPVKEEGLYRDASLLGLWILWSSIIKIQQKFLEPLAATLKMDIGLHLVPTTAINTEVNSIMATIEFLRVLNTQL